MAEAAGGKGQLMALVVIAVVLAAGYIALDFYSDGEKNKAITESHATQVLQALSRHKQDVNAYPDSLQRLVPKYAQALPTCPGGENFSYQVSGADYTLGCPNVAWKSKPYRFSSKTRTWED